MTEPKFRHGDRVLVDGVEYVYEFISGQAVDTNNDNESLHLLSHPDSEKRSATWGVYALTKAIKQKLLPEPLSLGATYLHGSFGAGQNWVRIAGADGSWQPKGFNQRHWRMAGTRSGDRLYTWEEIHNA